VKKRKKENLKMDMIRSIGKWSGESVESVLKKKKEDYSGKDTASRKRPHLGTAR